MTRTTKTQRKAQVLSPSQSATAAADAFTASLRPLIQEMLTEAVAKIASEFLQSAGYVVTHASELAESEDATSVESVEEEVLDDDVLPETPATAAPKKRVLPKRLVTGVEGNGHAPSLTIE